MDKDALAKFKNAAQKVHGNRYEYLSVEMVNGKKYFTASCKKHGIFKQLATEHISRKRICRDCAVGSLDERQANFIKQSNKTHRKKYDYSKVIYKNMDTKVEIICSKHGSFFQRASDHQKGSGCWDCQKQSSAKTRMKPFKEAQEQFHKVHKNKYQYKEADWKGMNVKIKIICPKHGEFFQVPKDHLGYGNRKEQGCPQCSKFPPLTFKEFLRRSLETHGSRYEYHKETFVDSQTKMKITCLEHGDFYQTPSKHTFKNGQGCRKCKNKMEGRIAKYLKQKSIVHREYAIKKKFFDFYLPAYNLIIERDGEQHYKNKQIQGAVLTVKSQQENDKLKTKLAKDAGFKIARIPYWLSKNEEEIEIENILAGKPTYPDVPDLKQEKTKPKPRKLTS